MDNFRFEKNVFDVAVKELPEVKSELLTDYELALVGGGIGTTIL